MDIGTVVQLAATSEPGRGGAWPVLLLAALGYAVAYGISIRLHPYRPCRRCGESGKHRGAIFTRSFRDCRRCGGTGRELRLFARER